MIAFIPALALQRATASPVMNPRLSFASLFAVSRVICSWRMSTAPAGKMPAASERWAVNRRGVRDQSVERDERRNCGKDRQQRIEDDPSRDSEQPVVIDARINAPEDILPSCPGNVPRSRRAPSPPRLLRSAQLRGNRLIVLELLPWPLVGIDLCRRTRFARDLATLVRRRVHIR